MEALLQALAAGGNVALVAIAVAIYRHEIRLIRLETLVRHIDKED
jgi:hypothetical protein